MNTLKPAVPALLLAVCAPWAWADRASTFAIYTSGNPILPISASAALDFRVRIERMIYLRVGQETGTSTVAFNLGPMTVPSVPTTVAPGNRVPVHWNGAEPVFAVPAAVALPVEVRSNAGGVQLVATVVAPLSSGSASLPMSDLSISSSDPLLPAPPVPASGSGTPVSVTPGGVGTALAPTLLTFRTATWTFQYHPANTALPGQYNGQLAFTASAP